MKISYVQYLADVDKVANVLGYPGSYTKDIGRNCKNWVDSYNNNASPVEAYIREIQTPCQSLAVESRA